MKKVVLFTAIVGFAIVGGYIAVNWRYMVTSDETAIIGFAGSLLSAVLTGLITFVALHFTFENERKKSQLDKELQIMPYLSLTFISDGKETKPCIFDFTINPTGNNRNSYRPLYKITNVGLGPAIETGFEIDDKLNTSPKTLKVNGASILAGASVYGKITYLDATHELHIKCTYKNMAGTSYEQHIVIPAIQPHSKPKFIFGAPSITSPKIIRRKSPKNTP